VRSQQLIRISKIRDSGGLVTIRRTAGDKISSVP
jgi:hypothetical protein